jgi:hypothetical protein
VSQRSGPNYEAMSLSPILFSTPPVPVLPITFRVITMMMKVTRQLGSKQLRFFTTRPRIKELGRPYATSFYRTVWS